VQHFVTNSSCCNKEWLDCRPTPKQDNGKGPLGRPRLRWEYNVKIGLKINDKNVDWINLAEDKDE
jgi:hypothetical protein